jgi:hypothetical protein
LNPKFTKFVHTLLSPFFYRKLTLFSATLFPLVKNRVASLNAARFLLQVQTRFAFVCSRPRVFASRRRVRANTKDKLQPTASAII